MNGQNLNDYRWENRILIIQSTDDTNQEYISQLNESKDQETELRDRKMLLCKVVGDNYQLTNYLIPTEDNTWQSIDDSFKNKFKSTEEFQIILIGLDGDTKFTKNKIQKIEELYRIIDSMPMRSSELRNKN
ncbi:DUF4174 domain-containing protein [Saprospiraceae bacterium]|nr:DUF4174 domain-containing protein [Saprospiraceae bacterium]